MGFLADTTGNGFDGKLAIDPRRYLRFHVNETAYVSIKGRNRVGGKIANISRGGLMVVVDRQISQPSFVNTIDIFIKEHWFYISNIACQIMRYRPSMGGTLFNHWGNSNANPREVGIEFLGLSTGQERCLEYFIRNYTK